MSNLNLLQTSINAVKGVLMRKCIYLMVVISFGAVLASEPTSKVKYAEKGVLELSGRVSGAYSNTRTSKSISISVAPGINYFVNNNWYLGTAFGLSYVKRDSEIQSYPDLTWSTGFSPAAHLGFANSLATQWYWFVEAGYFHVRYNCNYCGGGFIEHRLFANGGVKYDVGNGLISFGTSLSQSAKAETLLELFLGFSVYF